MRRYQLRVPRPRFEPILDLVHPRRIKRLRNYHQRGLRKGAYNVSDEESARGVTMIAVKVNRDIDVHDITVFEWSSGTSR
jgi:hypothetical protein